MKSDPGSVVTGKLPWQMGAFLLGSPLAILAVAIESEIESALAPGAYTPDVVFIALFLGFSILCLLPSYLYFRRIVVNDHGIVGFRYLGPRNEIAWPNIKSAEIVTITRGNQATYYLKLLPRYGRRIWFKSSQMSNFDELLATVEKRAPVSVIRHLPRPAVRSYEL